jgi:hypothetical protein
MDMGRCPCSSGHYSLPGDHLQVQQQPQKSVIWQWFAGQGTSPCWQAKLRLHSLFILATGFIVCCILSS